MPVGSTKPVQVAKPRTFWLVKSPRDELHRVFYCRPWDPIGDPDDTDEVIEVREVRP
jgi:hypothetical protein